MRSVLIFLLLATSALGAPPAIDIPPEVRPAGQYVTLSPKTEAAAITYIGLSEVEPIPSAALKDPRMFLLDTRGLAVGRYRFVAIGSLGDEHSRTDFAVVVGTPPVVVVPPGPGPPATPPADPTKATAVTYVYEKDHTAVPNAVLAAFDKLNRQNILANPFEQDTVDGSGEVPSQYAAALPAAKAAGLPALVVTAGSTVLKVVRDPKTEQQVFEAVGIAPPAPRAVYSVPYRPTFQPPTYQTRGLLRR